MKLAVSAYLVAARTWWKPHSKDARMPAVSAVWGGCSLTPYSQGARMTGAPKRFGEALLDMISDIWNVLATCSEASKFALGELGPCSSNAAGPRGPRVQPGGAELAGPISGDAAYLHQYSGVAVILSLRKRAPPAGAPLGVCVCASVTWHL